MHPSVSPAHVEIANQLYVLEKKLSQLDDSLKLNRPINRMKAALNELGLHIHDPIGEYWDETRTDCEATIAGTQVQDLVISEVIKPIIRQTQEGMPVIVQRGIVVVAPKASI